MRKENVQVWCLVDPTIHHDLLLMKTLLHNNNDFLLCFGHKVYRSFWDTSGVLFTYSSFGVHLECRWSEQFDVNINPQFSTVNCKMKMKENRKGVTTHCATRDRNAASQVILENFTTVYFVLKHSKPSTVRAPPVSVSLFHSYNMAYNYTRI